MMNAIKKRRTIYNNVSQRPTLNKVLRVYVRDSTLFFSRVSDSSNINHRDIIVTNTRYNKNLYARNIHFFERYSIMCKDVTVVWDTLMSESSFGY